MTGLVAANFTVNAGAGIGGTAPTIASVTGSGTTWTVTLGVTGTTGNYGTTSTATLGLTVVPAGASVTDAAGNAVSSATVSGTTESYNLDTTAPTAAVTYSPSRTVKSGETLTITATFNEAMTTAPTIALGGTNTVAATAMTSTSTTVWTYAHTVASGNGNVTVTLGGTDTAGNSLGTVTGTTFEVDNTAPAVAITYQEIADNASVPTSGYLSSLAHSVRGAKSVAIEVTATEAGGGATLTGSPAVTVTETGASSATTVTLTETSSGSKVWRGVYDVPSTGSDGTATVALTVSGIADEAGNVAAVATGQTTSFVIDNTAPSVAITYQEITDNASVPTSGYLASLATPVRGAKSVAIQVTATETGGGATLTGSPAVTVTPSGGSATTVTLTETSSGSKVWRGVYDVPSTGSDGTATVALTVSGIADEAGNVAA
ncbi:MAG: hypothetical protein EB039_12145, partial [Proteobacteria bacterium]|nr:hypothetical protein [Pseudomonadota bacterium]